MFTSGQLRAARAILRWDQKALAERSGVSVPTIKRLEAQEGEISANIPTLAAILAALNSAGVQFIAPGEAADGIGVVLRMQE